MATPTKEELEARRDQIDLQLARLIKLPAQYTVGRHTVNNSEMIETLRIERSNLERAIRTFDEPEYNSFNGPTIENV